MGGWWLPVTTLSPIPDHRDWGHSDYITYVGAGFKQFDRTRKTDSNSLKYSFLFPVPKEPAAFKMASLNR